MKFHQTYGGIIWTHHAIDRMKGRGLTQELAYKAYQSPDETIDGKNPGSTEFVKHINDYKITLIAKPNEKKEWIVISAWIDPPLPGSIDIKKRHLYKKYQKASFLGKLWLTLRLQVGI